jgi:hypothetical protein
MNRRNFFNAMMVGAFIMGLDRSYGADPVLGWATKSLLIMLFVAFLYVNLKGDE